MRNFLVKVSKNFPRRSAQNSRLAYSPCIYSGLLWLKMFVCGNLWFYRVKKKFFKKTRFWGKSGLFWYKRDFCVSKGGIRVQSGLIGFIRVNCGLFRCISQHIKAFPIGQFPRKTGEMSEMLSALNDKRGAPRVSGAVNKHC